MKIVQLAFYRVIHYFQENKLIFFLYLLGSITCVITFIYFYGNAMPNKYAEARNSLAFRQYYVTLNQAQNLKQDDFAFLKDSDLQDINLESGSLGKIVLKTASLPGGPATPDNPDNNDNQVDITMQAYMYGGTKIYNERGRCDFSQEELKSGKNVVILPSLMEDTFKSGADFSIKGVRYEMIGVHTISTGFYIPYQAYIKHGYTTKKFTVTLNKALSKDGSSEFTKNLYKQFPNSSIIDPTNYFNSISGQSPLMLLLLSVVYLISIASFLFLLKYLSDKNRSENVIYTMIGASKKNVMKIMVAENLLISFFSAVIAVALHSVFYSSFFSKINTIENITYQLNDYLVVFIFVLFLSVLTSVPFLISYSRNSIIHSKNKYD